MLQFHSRFVFTFVTIVVVWLPSDSFAESLASFHDDFEDGSATDDRPVTWVLDTPNGETDDPRLFVSDGRYIVAPDSSNLLATRVSNYPLTDFSVTAQMRLVGPPSGVSFVGLFARGTGTGSNNYWAGLGTDGRIYAGIQIAQNPTTLSSRGHSLDVFDSDVMLKMDFVGPDVTAAFWQEGEEAPEPQLSFRNETLPTGDIVGLWINPANSNVRAEYQSVEVTPLIDRFDFDNSSGLDGKDLDQLAREMANQPDVTTFDLNYDQTVDGDDAVMWLHDAAFVNGFSQTYLSGDANLDGAVDAADLNALALSWRSGESIWSGGDFNFDGITDAADLNALALNWQQSIPVAESLVAMAVPEPAWPILVLGAGIVILLRRSKDTPLEL